MKIKKKKARGDTKYVDKDERYDAKELKKQTTVKGDPPGLAIALKRAIKDRKSKKPKVKPTKKK
jgi:hypothetical protein